MTGFIHALQFLTVVRVSSVEADPARFARSTVYFPLVGALQGLAAAGSAWALSFILPWQVVSALVLVVLALTNGGLHVDGLADTVDGLAGGKTPERTLEIMRDSAVGPMGAAAVVLLMLVKYSAIANLPEGMRLGAVVAFASSARWAMVPPGVLARYARPGGGLGSAFSGVGPVSLTLATALAAGVAWLASGVTGLVALGGVGAGSLLMTWYFTRRLGGVTGDVFGFVSEVSEAVFLLVLLAIATRYGL